MFKLLLISIVAVPVLIGIQAAKVRNGQRGGIRALVGVLIYEILYVLMLYYLRIRWVG
jgi:hypothetical protein